MDVAILLLILHFIGDYLFQSRNMGNLKSRYNSWLTFHVVMYCVPLICMYPILGLNNTALFILMNGALHWIIDYFTSRIIKSLWESKKEYATFSMMGLDQLLHYISLFATYMYLTS